jgi:hypothetical protein
MKSRFISIAVIAGVLFLFAGVGFCQEKVSMNDWVEKVGQGSVNWSAGYIEAVGIGAPSDKSIGKANARPMAMRAAKVDAYRNLLEITKGVQVDSATSVKDFTVESDVINTQVSGMVKGAEEVKKEYMSDGTAEVTLRIYLYGKGNLAKIIMPSAIANPPAPPAPSEPAAPAPAAPAPPVPIAYTGMVVDARGIQARPAMSPRVFDEDGKEVYGSANVDREYAVQQGMSGYARDLTAAQSNQRVTASPITVKALRTNGPGKSDLIISNADAQQIRASAENMTFMKKCRVMVVLD